MGLVREVVENMKYMYLTRSVSISSTSQPMKFRVLENCPIGKTLPSHQKVIRIPDKYRNIKCSEKRNTFEQPYPVLQPRGNHDTLYFMCFNILQYTLIYFSIYFGILLDTSKCKSIMIPPCAVYMWAYILNVLFKWQTYGIKYIDIGSRKTESDIQLIIKRSQSLNSEYFYDLWIYVIR